MIVRDSKSYPYLAIAQYYNIDYGVVLRYSDGLKIHISKYPPFTKWKYNVWRLERNKFKINVDS